MYRALFALFVCALTSMGTTASAAATPPAFNKEASAWQTVKRDYANFYTRERFKRLGIAFSVGAVMANTHIDQGIRDWYQGHLRTRNSDSVSKQLKKLGNGYYVIPVSLLAMGIGQLSDDPEQSLIWQWGQRSFRAYLVGGPANLLAQFTTGASRPLERPDASHWRPFQDWNGVSGHAFVGAIPFLTIVHMSDNRWLRYSAYFASSFAGWSRINDDAHFASQVFLGWYMAYESTNAVADSDDPARHRNTHLALLPWPHGVLLAMDYHW